MTDEWEPDNPAAFASPRAPANGPAHFACALKAIIHHSPFITSVFAGIHKLRRPTGGGRRGDKARFQS